MEIRVLYAIKDGKIEIAKSENLRDLKNQGFRFIYKDEFEKQELDIKQKYRDLIFEKYSLTDQLNMSQQVQLITAMAQFEKRDLTEEEITILLQTKEAKDWIDQKRQECQDEISKISL